VYTQGFLKSVQNKLSNEKFVAGAREGVGKRKTKEADALAKIETIEHSLWTKIGTKLKPYYYPICNVRWDFFMNNF
jgi:hypothetical protein